MNEPKYSIATEMRKRDGAQNQDCGAAERLLMADGNFAYVAAIADGVSCCEMPREAASLAISHFRRAIEDTSFKELSDPSMRAGWLKSWNDALDEEVSGRVRDGYATFCALAVVPFPEDGGYGVLSLNVGDSSSFLVTGDDSRCVSMKPSDGGRRNSGDDGLMRGVGLDHRDGPLMDAEWHLYPADFSGYFWVGCDGVFNFLAGSDLRDLCLSGKNVFRELPQRALDLSMDEGLRQGKRALDNATAAVVGVNVAEGRTQSAPVGVGNAGGGTTGRRGRGVWRRIWLAMAISLAVLAFAAMVFLVVHLLNGSGKTGVPAEPNHEGEQPAAVKGVPDAHASGVGEAAHVESAASDESDNAASVPIPLPEIKPPSVAAPAAVIQSQAAHAAPTADLGGGQSPAVAGSENAQGTVEATRRGRDAAPSPSSPAIKANKASKGHSK